MTGLVTGAVVALVVMLGTVAARTVLAERAAGVPGRHRGPFTRTTPVRWLDRCAVTSSVLAVALLVGHVAVTVAAR